MPRQTARGAPTAPRRVRGGPVAGVAAARSPSAHLLLVPALASFALLGALVWRETPVDDAFIAFRYARNLAAGEGLVFNPGERVEGYSGLSWVLLLAAGNGLGLPPPALAKGLGLLLGAGTLLLVAFGGGNAGAPVPAGRPSGARALAACLVGSSLPFAYHAINGLETALTTFLLAALVLPPRDLPGRRACRCAAAALLAVTRPEGLLAVLLWAAATRLLRRRLGRDDLAVTVSAVAGFGVQLAFRWSYYGEWVANSARAKLLPLAFGLPLGLADLGRFAWHASGWGALLLVVLGSYLRRRRRRAAPGMQPAQEQAPLALFIVFFALALTISGGDSFPLWRFYIPLLPLFYVLAGESLAFLWSLPADARRPARRAAAATAGLLVLASAAVALPAQLRAVRLEGDWVRLWSAAGRALGAAVPPGTRIALCPVGALPYHAGLPVLDMLGLTDTHIARRPPDLRYAYPGHHRHDAAYVLARRPDLVMLANGPTVDSPGAFPWHEVRSYERDLATSPRFRREYRIIHVPLAPGRWLQLFARRDLPRPTGPSAAIGFRVLAEGEEIALYLSRPAAARFFRSRAPETSGGRRRRRRPTPSVPSTRAGGPLRRLPVTRNAPPGPRRRRMKKLVLSLVLSLLASSVFAGDGSILRTRGTPVPGRYIVQFAPGHDARSTASELALGTPARAVHVYEHAIRGAAFEMSEQQALAMARHPKVLLVEEDAVVTIAATQNNPPSWGLDRVDQRNLPLSGSYTFDFDGTGVNAYIIDTGIRTTHNDFGGRAFHGTDTVGDGQNGNDCHGHGTHVAGTVGGTSFGIAKNVTLFRVRVLNCQGSGTNAGVIAGVDWVTANHIKPAVANMSLGGGASTAVDNAVNNSVAAGVFYAVAAGNSNTNACNSSPARAANVYTVGSTTQSDARSSFSNFGTCVEIFAPGSSITSAWSTSNTATNTISGTSMATPHVAGAAALVLDEDPGLTPAQVASTLTNRATSGVLSGVGTGSPNLLLFTLGGGPPPPPPPPGPDPGTCAAGSIDFTSYGLGSYADQNVSNTFERIDSGRTVRLLNNTWLRSTQSYTVTANTVVEFKFASSSEGEIHSIGFDENQTLNDAPRHFQFWGDQNWTGAGKAQVTPQQYSGSGGYETFRVEVGDFFTGGSMRLVFGNDNDSGSGNEGRFACVRVFEDDGGGGGTCTVEESFTTSATGWANDPASTCSTGAYVRATPTLVTNGGVTTQPAGDHTSGTGAAMFTATNSSAGVNDVDGGNCILTSPVWSVPAASTLSAWWFHGQRDAGGDAAGDFFRLELSLNGGSTWTTLVSRGDVTSNAAWTEVTASIPAGSNVRLRMQASDGTATGDLVEAGIDDVRICE